MNAHEPWRSRQSHPELTGSYHRLNEWSVFERLREPSIIVPVVVLLATILYHSVPSISQRWPPLSRLLWDGFVAVIPARVLYALDGWLNPPLFLLPMPPAGQSAAHAAKSDVLRKILGIDAGGSGGIMGSVSLASRRFSGFGSGLGPASSFSFGGRGDVGQPAGLGNISNSCYQNSILQGLASLKPLPGYLRGFPAVAASEGAPEEEDDVGDEPSDTSGMRTANTLRDLIADLNSATNNGRTLWTPAVLKNMSTWQQQDAQEYFSKLLDEVDREISRAARALHKSPGLEGDTVAGCSTADDGTAASQHSDDSGYQSLATAISRSTADLNTLRNPLEGLIAQRVACVACGWSEGLSMIPFNCITLSLGMDQHEHDLFERLDAYTKVEPIEGVECGKCTLLKAQRLINLLIARSKASADDASDGSGCIPEAFARIMAIETALEEDDFDDKTITQKCKITQKVSSTKTKQAAIARAPQSLVVHMNRSVFDGATSQMFKNLAAVRFPMVLDLGPWCLGSAEGLTSSEMRRGDAVENETQGNSSAASSSLPADDEEQWLLSPTASMVAGDLHRSKITGPIYELRAVVTHYGRHENGHYVCYRKHPRPRPARRRPGSVSPHPEDVAEAASSLPQENADDEGIDTEGGADGSSPISVNAQPEENKEPPEAVSGSPSETTLVEEDEEEEEESEWWRLSDQNVTRVSEASVLSQGGVFMLFYDCVDPVPVLTSEALTEARDGSSDSSSLTPTPSPPVHAGLAAIADEGQSQPHHPCPTTSSEQLQEPVCLLDEPPLPPPPPLTLSVQSGDGAESLVQALSIPIPLDDEDESFG